jgi:hypothetical protein
VDVGVEGCHDLYTEPIDQREMAVHVAGRIDRDGMAVVDLDQVGRVGEGVVPQGVDRHAHLVVDLE